MLLYTVYPPRSEAILRFDFLTLQIKKTKHVSLSCNTAVYTLPSIHVYLYLREKLILLCF